MQLNVFHMFFLTVQGPAALQETNEQSLVYALLLSVCCVGMGQEF